MSDNDRFFVTLTLTQDDYAKALKAFVTPKARLIRQTLFWISIIVLGIFSYSWFATANESLVSGMTSVGAVAVAMVFLKYGAPYFAARSFVKKNQDKLGPNYHEIGPEGAVNRSQHGEAKVAWTVFHQIRETPDLFLLYTQSNFAQIVPKHCFASQSDIERYREIVRRHYTGKMELAA